MIVMLGELGGVNEYAVVDALKDGRITKPVVAWVSGTCAAIFPTEVQFGHAGARSGGGDSESAAAKNAALKAAGAHVPTSFDTFGVEIARVFAGLGLAAPERVAPPALPMNFKEAKNRIRKTTSIVSTICDDRGEEPKYAGVSVVDLIERNATVGDAISLLWFKRELPPYATRFIDMVLVLVADHGPSVSGAHNSIVAARAGKDLVSALASGLLTIGPRFGGAIDDAARLFHAAVTANQTPDEFVASMKQQKKRISGIGHRIKSADNYDRRVLLLIKYAKAHFPTMRHLEFAQGVEKLTLKKASNLVLNVDGAIGSIFLDLMESCASFSRAEIDEIVDTGYLNAFFVIGRSVGLVGHVLDQKRLGSGLYRHETDDVLYLTK